MTFIAEPAMGGAWTLGIPVILIAMAATLSLLLIRHARQGPPDPPSPAHPPADPLDEAFRGENALPVDLTLDRQMERLEWRGRA